MGDEQIDDKPRKDGLPRHEVVITRPFFMGVFEVTQEQYRRVMGPNPSAFSEEGSESDRVRGMNTGSFPVENVTWKEAVEFCERMSKLPEEKKMRRRYRLPTEAEWEYCCRAGTDTPFAFGDKLDLRLANLRPGIISPKDAKSGWLERPTVVGSYKPNRFGLYDMHGNVAEWCQDYYDPTFYKRSPKEDPQGPSKEELLRMSFDPTLFHIFRGGSWYSYPRLCTSASRDHVAEEDTYPIIGFRVLCDQK